MCRGFSVAYVGCKNVPYIRGTTKYPERLYEKLENTINESPTRFGYEILRDHVLPSILGPHESDILYWAGKEVARKFPIFNVEELPTFFTEAGWGMLSLEKENKHETYYILTNDADTMKAAHRTFHLEAGFIAEQYQKLGGLLTECFAEPIQKGEAIQFHVKWDPKAEV